MKNRQLQYLSLTGAMFFFFHIFALHAFSKENVLDTDSIPGSPLLAYDVPVEFIRYLNMYEDASSKLTFQDVKSLSPELFVPLGAVSQFKSGAVYWAKLNININSDIDLLLKTTGSDFIDIYYPQADDWINEKTGRLVPSSRNCEIYTGTNITLIHLEANSGSIEQIQTIYFRLYNFFENAPGIEVQLWYKESGIYVVQDEVQEKSSMNFGNGLILGVLWLIMTMSFILFLIQKQNEYLLYSLYVLGISLFLWSIERSVIFNESRVFDFFFRHTIILGSFYCFFRFMNQIIDIKGISSFLFKAFKQYHLLFIIMIVALFVPTLVLKNTLYYKFTMLPLTILMVIPVFYVNIKLLAEKEVLNKIFSLSSLLLVFGGVAMASSRVYDFGFEKLFFKISIVLQVLAFAYILIYRMQQNEKKEKEAREKLIVQLEKNQELQTKVNRELEQKVQERTLELAEKNEELNQQNEEISAQRDEIESQRDLVLKQKDEIEKVHHEVSQSIDYAQRIQASILPEEEILKMYVSDFFVFFRPRDIVSGDFYWWGHIEGHTIITAADCTGHGVPGAFMSMLGVSFLREIVTKEYITHPGVILRKLRKEIVKSLKQKGESGEQKDGMDMALISINHEENRVQFSGANNSLYVLSHHVVEPVSSGTIVKALNNDGQLPDLYEIKPDKMPVSIYQRMDKFTCHEFKYRKGDKLYMFSDGFADQFGGEKGKKFMYKPFKRLIVKNAGTSMPEQKRLLNDTFNSWKGLNEQVDDVLVLGLEL